MIYARDQWVQLPVKDIYDSQIMMASINAAKDMYEKGGEQIKDFNKQYGDFFSPIQSDMDWYNKNVIGAARDQLNDLYSSGIDPARSAEGRAIISRFINQVPYGKINEMKQSAASAQEFIKNRDKLLAEGRYSPEMDAMLGGAGPESWNTIQNGIFTRTSPIRSITMQEFVHPSFQGIKPHALSKEEVESRGYKYDPNYDYTGITRKDMQDSVRDWMPGMKGNPYYDFFREQARQDLIRQGNENPTNLEIDRQFMDNAITADHQVMTPFSYDANPYAQLDYKDKIDDANAARDFNYRMRERQAEWTHDENMQRERNAGNGGSTQQITGNGSFIDELIRENLSKNAGVSVANYNPIKLSQGNDARQAKQFKAYGSKIFDHIFRKNVDPNEFIKYLGNTKYGGNSVYASKFDVDNIYTQNDLFRTMSGSNQPSKKMSNTKRQLLKNIADSGRLVMKTTGRSGVVKHNSRGSNKYRQELYFEVELWNVDSTNNTSEKVGTYYLDSGGGTYEERGVGGTISNVAGSVTELNRNNLVTTRDRRVGRNKNSNNYNTRSINGY